MAGRSWLDSAPSPTPTTQPHLAHALPAQAVAILGARRVVADGDAVIVRADLAVAGAFTAGGLTAESLQQGGKEDGGPEGEVRREAQGTASDSRAGAVWA